MNQNTIYQGEALEVLKTFPDESIDCVMTSPPYWGLRDYGVEGQLGLEPTAQKFIDRLCDIFDEIKRILRPHGTVWINLGDTYINYKYGKSTGQSLAKGTRREHAHEISKNASRDGRLLRKQGFMDKSLAQIPSRFAIAMSDRRWILRNEIIWHKPNCMPSSIKDRFTVDFEKIFFFTKQQRYYFEQQFEPYLEPLNRWGGSDYTESHNGKYEFEGLEARPNPEGRNKRAVWAVPTAAYADAHFATYPIELCVTPIKAGCPEFVCKKCGKARQKIFEPTEEYAKFLGKSWNPHIDDMKMGFGQQTRGQKKGDVAGIKRYNFKGYTDCGCNAGFQKGIVLDPFFGSGTTALAARQAGRDWLGIELNYEYLQQAKKRLAQGVLI